MTALAANNVESAVSGRADPGESLALLLASPSHRPHLLGEGWYAVQTVYGVGNCESQFVVLAAPVESG